MIVPDVNLVVYAYSSGAPEHDAARDWWEASMSGQEALGIPWVTSMGFIRLMTHARVMTNPMRPAAAVAAVRSWLQRPNVEILEPGSKHLDILSELLDAIGVGGSLTTDAHLAALAIEYQAEVFSNDADFARFPGLRWRNPIDRGG